MKIILPILLFLLPVLPLFAMTPAQEKVLLEKVQQSRLNDRKAMQKRIKRIQQQYRLRHPRPKQLSPQQRHRLKQRYLRFLRQQRPAR